MVFYKAEKFERNGLVVTPHQPCILLIKNANSKNLSCHIQDPSQSRLRMQVDITNNQLGSLKGYADYTNVPEGYEGMSKSLQFAVATKIQSIDSGKNGIMFDCNIYAGQPFTIKTNKGCDSQITITNLSGILCYTGSVSNGQAVCKVNTSGLYFLSIKTGTSVHTTKIIVK